jgi:DUF2905 family protein
MSVSSVVWFLRECFVGKTLVLIGLGIAGLGLLVIMGVPLGRLPGDFAIKRGNFSFYFPLATSIILSIFLTLILAFFRR